MTRHRRGDVITRPTVATVVSARPWESAFVGEATSGARLRLVARIDQPGELARVAPWLDVVVVGAETPWLEQWMPDTLARLGCSTIGVHVRGDQVGARLVERATVCAIESTSPETLVDTAWAAAQSETAILSVERSTSDPHTQRYKRAPGSTGR